MPSPTSAFRHTIRASWWFVPSRTNRICAPSVATSACKTSAPSTSVGERFDGRPERADKSRRNSIRREDAKEKPRPSPGDRRKIACVIGEIAMPIPRCPRSTSNQVVIWLSFGEEESCPREVAWTTLTRP